MISGERVVFMERVSEESYVQVIVRGELDLEMIETVRAFLDRQSDRLAREPMSPRVSGPGSDPGLT